MPINDAAIRKKQMLISFFLVSRFIIVRKGVSICELRDYPWYLQ